MNYVVLMCNVITKFPCHVVIKILMSLIVPINEWQQSFNVSSYQHDEEAIKIGKAQDIKKNNDGTTHKSLTRASVAV